MTEYKCFSCNKIVTPEQMRKRVRCIYCGSKVLFKTRTIPKVVKAI